MSIMHAFRLQPGQDLKREINNYVSEHTIEAGFIATCVGSITRWNIRFANQKEGSTGEGYFEIISLSGTVSPQGLHLHINISDPAGKTIGGHLLEGTIIYTTAEIVLQELEDMIFERLEDGSTPWKELQIRKKSH